MCATGFMSRITAARICCCSQPGDLGQGYNIGGDCERSNIAVVTAICDTDDDFAPDCRIAPRERLITFVTDRPGP